jgi:hypothetical protein
MMINQLISVKTRPHPSTLWFQLVGQQGKQLVAFNSILLEKTNK